MGRRPIRACLPYCLIALALPTATAWAGDIDPYAYDYAHGCRKHPQPGMLAMQRWLEHHAKGESWGIMRCEKLSGDTYSLHSEGRALDWHLDAHDSSDRKEAQRLLHL